MDEIGVTTRFRAVSPARIRRGGGFDTSAGQQAGRAFYTGSVPVCIFPETKSDPAGAPRAG